MTPHKSFVCLIDESELEQTIIPQLKARMSLLDPDFLMEMAKVGDFGTKKYAEEDWRDNDAIMVKVRLDSLARHVAKFNSNNFSDLDHETNISHLAHAAFNCMMIWWIAKYRSERDNRYKGAPVSQPNTDKKD